MFYLIGRTGIGFILAMQSNLAICALLPIL